MQAYLFKNRSRLQALIADIWQWETIEKTVQGAGCSRVEALHLAAKGQCVCEGLWRAAVTGSLVDNRIPVQELCRDVLHALTVGRHENTPVLVLAGAQGGEGKSLFFKGLAAVYGIQNVFYAPESDRFPFLNLPGKRIAVLDEWRFDERVLRYSTQQLWYDGSPLVINQPQNNHNSASAGGHEMYVGGAPIFVTTKLAAMERLEAEAGIDPGTGGPKDADASMMLRRLKVYQYRVRAPKPPRQFSHCPHCFAHLVLNQQ